MGIISLDTGDRAANLLRRQFKEMVRLHGIPVTFKREDLSFDTNILLSTRPQNFVEGMSWTVIDSISAEALYAGLPVEEDFYIPQNGDVVDLTYKGSSRTYEIYRVDSQSFPAFVFYKLILNPYYLDTAVPDNNPTDDDLQLDPTAPQKDSPVYDNDIYDY